MTDISKLIKASIPIIGDADAYRVYTYAFLSACFNNNADNIGTTYLNLQNISQMLQITGEALIEALRRLESRELITTTFLQDCTGVFLDIPNCTLQAELEPKSKTFSMRKQLLEDGADAMYVDAYMEVRKKKRAANTIVAYNLLKSEAKLAGLDIPQVVKICAEHNWQGFRHTWEFERPEETKQEPSVYQ